MKVLKAGHLYEVQSFEGRNPQTIQFIEKVPGEKKGDLVTVADGTTNEEVIEVLINRITYLNQRLPCKENKLALQGLHMALQALEHRTAKRKAQGIEGTDHPLIEEDNAGSV